MTHPSDSVTRSPIFSGEPFERIVAALIALVTIIAAVVGYLQSQASILSDRALREAQTFAIEALSQKAAGEIETGYAWTDLWRSWSELDSQAIIAADFDDAAAAKRYETIRDRLAGLSPLLAPPYFDPEQDDEPDVSAFEADLYVVDSTYLTERFLATFETSEAWGDKADTYVAHLTILAVTLFLYGLSVTLIGQVRWLFVILGSLFALVTVIWVLVIYVRPISTPSEPAIRAYAEGVGRLHRAAPEEAIEAFNQALALAPAYAAVYFERGNAYFDLEQLEQAAADYEAAIATGRGDISTIMELSRVYYFQGRLADALRLAQTELTLGPDQVVSYLDVGVINLAAGQVEAAQTAFDQAMTLAEQQVVAAREASQEPPDSLWWYLDVAATDLDSLSSCLTEQECSATPPYDIVSQTGTDAAAVDAVAQQLKELTVALEYTGRPPDPSTGVAISSFEFAAERYDDNDEFIDYDITDTFPADTGDVVVLLTYSGMQDGQQVVVKVFVDGEEDPTLRVLETWDQGQAGETELLLSAGLLSIFSPGDYWVEMYVDAHLVAQEGFTVEE
ncbi:MAG: tetratricopeptide repeat protein [Anaerolineaceae bacterium]|nr:tetratricopeptide repeat protein [Anaerolineaceae bacterium]